VAMAPQQRCRARPCACAAAGEYQCPAQSLKGLRRKLLLIRACVLSLPPHPCTPQRKAPMHDPDIISQACRPTWGTMRNQCPHLLGCVLCMHAKPRPASGGRGLMHSPHEPAATAGSGLQATPTSDQREEMALLAQKPHKLCGTTRAQPRVRISNEIPTRALALHMPERRLRNAVSPAEQVHTQVLPKQLHGHVPQAEELPLPQRAWHVHGCLLRAAAMHTHEQRVPCRRARPGRSMHRCSVVVSAVGSRAAAAPCRQPTDASSSASSHASSAHVAAEVRMLPRNSQRGGMRCSQTKKGDSDVQPQCCRMESQQAQGAGQTGFWPAWSAVSALKRQAHTAHVCGSLRVLTLHGAMQALHAK